MNLRPGTLIRNQVTATYETASRAYQGTLGCFVRRRGGDQGLYFLSAAHVMAVHGLAQKGQIIEWSDLSIANSPWIPFATLEDFVPFGDPAEAQAMDVALGKVINPGMVASARVGVFDVLPKPPMGLPAKGDALSLYGANSKAVSEAEVLDPDSFTRIDYPVPETGRLWSYYFGGQVTYGRQTAQGFAAVTKRGDSGALVFDEAGQAIGLHIAAMPKDSDIKASVCTPLGPILEHFKVDLLTTDLSHAPVSVTTSAGQTPSPASPAASTGVPVPLPAAQEAVIDANPNLASVSAGTEEMFNRLADQSIQLFGESIVWMFRNHNLFDGSIKWRMSLEGLRVDGDLPRTRGAPITVDRIWRQWGDLITAQAKKRKVPAELIVATICTESKGKPKAVRFEPSGVVSVGLMQTLVSTAQEVIGDDASFDSLKQPAVSIKAGTKYIHRQRRLTSLDPPVVACAYNAGRVRFNNSAGNRWRMRQHPIGTGQHADRFVAWFNDCFAYFGLLAENRLPQYSGRIELEEEQARQRLRIPAVSFYNATRSDPASRSE